MMDDLQKIRAFIDVVENGSFSAAARLQGVSTSSIARRIQALEDELGVRLVNRNTRRLSIAEAGQAFYERTREAVRELDLAKAEAVSYQQTIKGVLRVSMRISVSTMILPQIGQFLAEHEGLTIDLSMTDERLDLLKNNIDVAVWVGQLNDSELIARRLSHGQRLLCGSPEYFARHGTPRHPSELNDHICLAFRAAAYDGTWTFTKGDERHEVTATGPFQSSSGLALMSAAMSGIGLVVLQRYMVQRELEAGTLVPVLQDYNVSPTKADSAIYAVYPHSRHLSPKARAFIDFLLACFREQEIAPVQTGAATA